MKKLLLVLVAFVVGMSSPLQGAVLIRELFDGLNGSLNGAGDSGSSIGFEPGTTWLANRTDNMMVANNFNVNPGVTNQAPWLLNANGGIWWSVPASEQWNVGWWATRQLAGSAQINFAADGVYYVTYNMRRRNDSGVGFGLATGSTPESQFVSVGATWNTTGFNAPANRKLAVAVGTLNVAQGPYGAHAHSSTQVNNDDRNLILIKITTSSTGDDTVQAAFFNAARPGYGALPIEEANVVWDVTHSFSSANIYSHLLAYMNGPTASVELDAFRLANSYSDLVQLAPVITQQPVPSPSSDVFTGTSFSMSVAVSGGWPTPTYYQWHQDGVLLPLETNATFMVANATAAHAGAYYVVVSNEFGVAFSVTNEITILAAPPGFASDPKSATRYAGSSLTLSASLTGSAPFQLQWERDGVPIPDATNAVLTIGALEEEDAGSYVLLVTNSLDWISSTPATVTLLTPVAGSYEEFVVTNRPVAYWRFNEVETVTAFDYAGGYDALSTDVASVAGVSSPEFPGLPGDNAGASYNGISSGSTTTASLMNNRAQFTIMGWFNAAVIPQPGSGNGRVALFGQNDAAELGFHGTTQVGIWTPNGGFAAFDTSALEANHWYFLAAVGTGTNLTIYVNGTARVSVATTTSNYGSSSSPFRIGTAVLDSAENFFNGVIDEVALFDRALPVEILNALYAKAAGIVPPGLVTAPAGQSLYSGSTARFRISVSGTLPMTYEWYLNGALLNDGGNISGAETAELTIANVGAEDVGEYSVFVMNSAGFIDTTPVMLEVVERPQTGYASLVLDQEPAAYWAMEEAAGAIAAFDYVGGYNGTFGSEAVAGVAGPRPPEQSGFPGENAAVRTTGGASSWVSIPPLNLNTDTATFLAWIYPEGVQGGFRGIVLSRGSGTVAGLHFGDGNELRYSWNDLPTTWGWNPGLILPQNQWSFVALVVTPTNGTLYLGANGALQSAVNSIEHPVQAFAATSYIGQDSTGGRVVTGSIDEVAIFKRALSTEEISSLYLGGLGQDFRLEITRSTNVVVDSKPAGLPLDGLNTGAAWIDTETDGSSLRSGVMRFTSVDTNQIRIPASASFNSPTGTIAFWVRSAGTSGSGNEGAILFDRRASQGDVIALLDDGSLMIQPEWMYNATSTRKLNDNLWHHIAYVYDQSTNGSINIYIDGTIEITRANPRAWSWPATQPLEFGRSHDDYWKALDGALDDIRIYNRPLDAAEVAQIAAGDAPVTALESLAARFNFDGAPGGFLIHWSAGELESATTVEGPYSPVSGATAPWPVSGSGTAAFYRAVIR